MQPLPVEIREEFSELFVCYWKPGNANCKGDLSFSGELENFASFDADAPTSEDRNQYDLLVEEIMFLGTAEC